MQVQTLPNGLQLAVVEMHKVPVVDVGLLVRAGAARDPQDLPGLATFIAGMLDEGAGERGALEIAEEVDYLGASLGAGAGLEKAQLGLHVHQGAAAGGARPDGRRGAAAGVRRLGDRPPAGAAQERAAAAARPAHPGRAGGLPRHRLRRAPLRAPAQGDDASTAALDRDRVVRFYETHYRPENATLLVVGDVTPAEARALVEARFGGWAKGEVPAAPAAAPPAPAPRTFYLVDKPGAAQSVIQIGHVGVPRSTPDYYALRVLNTILGGSFTSRLNQNLRETARLHLRRPLVVRRCSGWPGRSAPARRCRPPRPTAR